MYFEKINRDLFDTYDVKEIGVLMYLILHQNKVDIVDCNVKDIVSDLKYGSQSKELFLKAIDGLIIKNIIVDCMLIKDRLICKLNIYDENNEKGFFKLEYKDIDKILNHENSDMCNILTMFFYFKSKIISTTDSEDIVKHGGKACALYGSQKSISSEVGISESTLKKVIKKLKTMELIFYENIGVISKNNTRIKANNVFAFDIHHLYYGLIESYDYYKKDKYKVYTTKKAIHKLVYGRDD